MARGLDHIVHAVRDLDAAAALYRRLGFTLGARNRHPWGTDNHIVQLRGFFVELLAVAEPDKIAPPAPRIFSFGAFTRDFLARGEGFAMLVLESRDARADAAAFSAARIGEFSVFDFARGARRPDGSPVEVAFSLAFARDERAPDIGFFTCQQHHPENFWNPAFQTHANGAGGVAGVVLVAENPVDHRNFLSAFTGEPKLRTASTGIEVATPRGNIGIMTAAAFRGQFGVEPPDIAAGARIAALRLAVGDIAATAAVLKAAGLDATVRMGRIVVAPESTMGATLVFETP